MIGVDLGSIPRAPIEVDLGSMAKGPTKELVEGTSPQRILAQKKNVFKILLGM
jgi:hypothetical protein